LAQFCEEESYPEDIQELLEAVDAFYDKTLELQHQFDETLTVSRQIQRPPPDVELWRKLPSCRRIAENALWVHGRDRSGTPNHALTQGKAFKL
ncbi:hypothetical protein T4D_496, partial [Trichinella pseudospiralis]